MLKPNDVVIVKEPYNDEAQPGTLAIVESIDSTRDETPLVTIRPVLGHSPYGPHFRTQIFDFRLEKIGEL